MAMEFLKLYDVTEIFKKDIKNDIMPNYKKMYIQEDTRDFHVLRIIEGDYDGNKDVFTVEREEISKIDVLEKLNQYEPGMEVRGIFKYFYSYGVLKTILEMDADKGYENYEFSVVSNFEEALKLATSERFEVEEVEYIEEKTNEGNGFKLHYSLLESDMLLQTIINDNRFNGYKSIIVKSYQNGREQGYSLNFLKGNEKMSISFAQQRNSDSLVVFYGLQRNTSISEEAYRNSARFEYRDFKKVRDYIFEILERDAEKGVSNNEVKMDDSLAMAQKMLEKIRENPFYQMFDGSIECLQEGKYNGYALCPYSTKTPGSFFITFAKESKDNIVVHSGEYGFQGLPCGKGRIEKTFNVKDIEEAVEYIYSILKERCKVKAA